VRQRGEDGVANDDRIELHDREAEIEIFGGAL
jgi:hypothetical protein